MIDIFKLSNKYLIKRLDKKDADDILNLEIKNINYYKYHSPLPTINSVIEELNVLPNNKDYKDKYFIGYYTDNKLIAIMDLIDNYPNDKCVLIGLFMVDVIYQSKGIGTTIIDDLTTYLKNNNYLKIRIGIDKDNEIANNFWKRSGFKRIEEKIIDQYSILVAEKNID